MGLRRDDVVGWLVAMLLGTCVGGLIGWLTEAPEDWL